MSPTSLRRLDAAVPASLYHLISRETLSCAFARRELDEVAATFPQLILSHKGNTLTAIRHGNTASLAYAFSSRSDFADYFAPMFEKLLPKIRKAYAPDTIRFRLTDGPSRPVVEPHMRRLSFEPTRTWFQFSLENDAKSPKLAPPRNVVIRGGGIDDIDALVRLDHDCFPSSPTPRSAIIESLESGEEVLLATVGGEPVGCAIYRAGDEPVAYLHTLAVDEGHRGKAIGAALAMRVAKIAFSKGAGQLDLRTEDDNTSAIRLYTKLGFRHSGSGRDYERPADQKVIDEMRRQAQGTFIKFGGWR